jgi:hypothetical protein
MTSPTSRAKAIWQTLQRTISDGEEVVWGSSQEIIPTRWLLVESHEGEGAEVEFETPP